MSEFTITLRAVSIIFFVLAVVVLVAAKRFPEVSEWLLAAIWVLLLI